MKEHGTDIYIYVYTNGVREVATGPCELRDSLNFVIHLELVREEGEERNEASHWRTVARSTTSFLLFLPLLEISRLSFEA